MKIKKYRIHVLVLMIVCVYLFTGCKPLSVDKDETQSWQDVLEGLKEIAPNEVESHIEEKVSDSLSIDADIVISEELSAYSVGDLTMYRHLFENDEKETILRQLVDKCGWWSQNELPEMIFETTSTTIENGENESILLLDTDEGKNAWVRDLSLMAINQEFSQRYGDMALRAFFGPTWNPNCEYREVIEETVDLDFCTVIEAENDIREFTESLGIEFSCDSLVYTCTLERLNQIIEKQKNYYEQWNETYDMSVTKADEAYIMVLQQGYQGIPLFPYHLSNSVINTTASGNSCYAFYSAEGIEEMELRNVYDIKEAGKKNEIMSLGEVLELYCSKYGNELGVKETIKRIQLYYLPICTDKETLEFTAKPIWYFESYVERNANLMKRAVVFDAVTGEVLPW